MGNLERLAIGVSSIAGVTGIGVFLNKSLYTDTIRSKLEANNFEILNKNDKYGIWEEIIKAYKEVAKQADSKFKFSKEVSSAEALKEECKNLLQKRVGASDKENNPYEKAQRWCTVPTTVLEVLKKERTILDTDTKNEEESKQGEWDKKIQEYTKKDNENKISNFELDTKETPPPPQKDKKKENRKKIKEKCQELNKKKSYEEGYEDALKKSSIWCTIEKKSKNKHQ